MQGVAIAVMVIIIVFLLIKIFNIRSSKREGIENMNNETLPIQKDTLESFNASIQAKINNLNDALMLKKNKRQYETAIINMDDYINLLMMQQITRTTYDSGIETTVKSFETLNTLKNAKDSLNTAMVYLDKQ